MRWTTLGRISLTGTVSPHHLPNWHHARSANGMARWCQSPGRNHPFARREVNLREREAQPGHLKKRVATIYTSRRLL